MKTFEYTIKDELGIHARPAGMLVKEVKKNSIAKRVKLADLAHNSDESRFAGSEHTAEQIAYWRQKYSKAKAILLE